MKQYKFDDKVFCMRIDYPKGFYQRQGYNPFEHSFLGLGFTGTVEGKKEMKDGRLYYVVKAKRYDLLRREEMRLIEEEVMEIPANFCFDDPEDMIKQIQKELKEFAKIKR